MKPLEELRSYKKEILDAIPAREEELEKFRILYLGSKNILKPLFAKIKSIPPEERREFGQRINANNGLRMFLLPKYRIRNFSSSSSVAGIASNISFLYDRSSSNGFIFLFPV